MPDLVDRLYCSEQIHIPPTFPYIMKLYCKAAIRTQPYDLLKWSAAYFRALANGEEPPAKERVEYPPYDSPSGLTPGYIKILINQFGKDPLTTITAQTLFRKWSDICLDEFLLIKLIALLGANTSVNWVRFVGVCAGFISKTLTQTMVLVCELFTEEPEGGMATVPYDLFIDLYMFLAQMECGPLTDEEKAEQDAIMDEEDICDVAEKITKGIYEGEEEGEMMYAGEAMGEAFEEAGEGGVCEDKSLIGELESRKGSDSSQTFNAGGDASKAEEVANQKEEEKDAPTETGDEDGAKTSETSLRDQESVRSVASGDESSAAMAGKEERKTSAASDGEEEEEAKPPPSPPKPERKILLEDLEETIRVQIEEKLAEEESLMDEEEREFEDLDSYLLSAAKRVEKFTVETMGFKIFKKYLRQEVPGIGPQVDSAQVEQVVDFLDSWSHKQEQMVMPRNIRHWMCPPLDKVPTQDT